jgi:outer membrane lipoprotein-sorting protein
MKQKTILAAALAMATLWSAPVALGQARAADSPTLDTATKKLVTEKIKDMSATLRVTETNWRELEKCGSDFKRTYYFKRMNVAYQYPNRTRMETKALGSTLLIIFNGDTRYYKVPFKTETSSVAGQPGQKQGLLQFGIYAPDYLTLDYEPHFIRAENNLQLIRLTQRRSTNKSYELVWVNPKTHIIERRQSWNGDNVLTMELRYKDVKEARPGIFVPNRIEIYNPEGKLGAAQAVENLTVNTGLADALFATSDRRINQPPDTNAARFYHRAAFVLLLALLILRLTTAVYFGLAWGRVVLLAVEPPPRALLLRRRTGHRADDPRRNRDFWEHPARRALRADPDERRRQRPDVRRRLPLVQPARRLLDPGTRVRVPPARHRLRARHLRPAADLLLVGGAVHADAGTRRWVLGVGCWGRRCTVQRTDPSNAPKTQPQHPTPSSTPTPPSGGSCTGLCVGLGTITKPTMIFFAPGVLLLLTLVPAYRKHFPRRTRIWRS